MSRHAWIVLVIAVLGIRAAAWGAELPNVVLVMADDQGWGDMRYNGAERLLTPHFDELARQGVRFERFHAAAPVCSPTRGSVMTGRTPVRYACYAWGRPVRPQEKTIAQMMRSAGYRTGHFGKWHLGSVQAAGKATPGAMGFDEWVSAPNFFDRDPVLSDRGKAVEFTGDSSDVTMEQAVKFIRRSVEDRQRFFAVVWFGSPHGPHDALEEDQKPYADLPANLRNFYGEITAMDRAFGRLRQTLRELGVRENTLVWYCSDNGALPKVGSSGGRRGNKGQVYEGGLLVPALLEWPARIAGPRVVEAPCVTSDIYPTIAQIVGATVPAPDHGPIDGESLLPILEGRAAQRTRPIGFWDYPGGGVSTPSDKWMKELLASQRMGKEPADPGQLFASADQIVALPEGPFTGHAAWLDGDWKLHRIEDKKGKVKWELYDLVADPKESKDQSAADPKRTAKMRAELETWLKSVKASHNGADYR
jgi:arylsulfatase A-like enzyme